jgi:cytochrome c-type biogenesis protein CcmF
MIDSAFQFVLYPEAELNKSMGILAHPDRKVRWNEDIYVHVSSIPDPEGEENEMQTFELRMGKGDSAKTQNSLIILDNLVQVKDVPELAKYDFVAKAKLIVLHKGKEYAAEPIFIIDDKQPLSLSALVQEAGISFTFSGVDVDAGKVVITAEEISEPPDWVVFKAISKPWINLLWLGTFILTLGFMIAIWRRVS